MAAFPLYRRRAAVVTSTCRQFDIDYSNPLVIHRMAKAQGVSAEELRKGVDGSFEALSEDEVEAGALEHYGSKDGAALFKARLALEAERRLPGRVAFVSGIQENTVGECALSLPDPPDVRVRGSRLSQGPRDALPVYLFANFQCRHCSASFDILERLEARFTGRLRVELRHHFPDTFLPMFEEALAAVCRGEWKRSADARGADFEACLRDPRSAVRVLDDTQEALRLGFREAAPSWVIGLRPRRGFQGEAILAETIEEQLRRGDPQKPRPR